MSLAAEGPAEAGQIGEIPGVAEGQLFPSREELARAGVHREVRAGITGKAARGAESIVLSGGYDDIDRGDTLIYTGHGGQNEAKEQVSDQSFSARGNAALKTSMILAAPVRVIRGRGKNERRNAHIFNPPLHGYRYDGLYFVVECRYEVIDDFRMCRFVMVKADPVDTITPSGSFEISSEKWHGGLPLGNSNPDRRAVNGSRVSRSAEVANSVKKLYDHTCQICGNRLEVSGRGYSEGAHIQPVSGGHDGPDVPENMLCLCPNCHVQFDYGAIIIHEDYTLTCNGEPVGELRRSPAHRIDKMHLAYHCQRFTE
ncbi:hypothetical protein DMA12_13590 [Amycolatopsis balhimycina DSM 5908]|uniref:YDG domain-containing protein n=1 Tax=Amycolatopsis balhimycina DSM 5908 TaxID=1081091 RepID=A0A428WQX6_AMYBA|nr:YDG/SRA domain-containing protein [Amycolatopsis balhimycina]RSM45491.1 hypothetical protein DMA12_13590 [Amycolatopsis balhimycina DSM 5908]